MARLPRLVVPAQPLHLIQHGINRAARFFVDEDFSFYRDAPLQGRRHFDRVIVAYVFVTDRVHLLMTPCVASAP